MLKHPLARNKLESAVGRTQLTGARLYGALRIVLQGMHGACSSPEWQANCGAQSYAVGFMVWCKRIGLIADTGKRGDERIRLGETGSLRFLRCCSPTLERRLDLILELDGPARACQLRLSGTQS